MLGVPINCFAAVLFPLETILKLKKNLSYFENFHGKKIYLELLMFFSCVVLSESYPKEGSQKNGILTILTNPYFFYSRSL